MIPKSWSLALVFLLALFGAAYAAEDGTAVALPAGTVVVPDGLKAADVQKAIILAGTGRGWTVKEKGDDKVVLFLEQGGWRSTLTLAYSTKEIALTSNSGKVNKQGVVQKPAIPESWVKYIKQDLNKHMGLMSVSK